MEEVARMTFTWGQAERFAKGWEPYVALRPTQNKVD